KQNDFKRNTFPVLDQKISSTPGPIPRLPPRNLQPQVDISQKNSPLPTFPNFQKRRFLKYSNRDILISRDWRGCINDGLLNWLYWGYFRKDRFIRKMELLHCNMRVCRFCWGRLRCYLL